MWKAKQGLNITLAVNLAVQSLLINMEVSVFGLPSRTDDCFV